MLDFVLSFILPFVAMLTLLVFVHELGHYLAARWCGVRVEVFSIGFGREIFGFNDRAGTRWRVSAIPLGGYVRFFGDADATSSVEGVSSLVLTEAEKARQFHVKSLWRRAVIVVAGPVGNFIFAIMALALLYSIYGQNNMPAEIGRLAPGGPAASAGLQVGDVVEEVDGAPIIGFEAFQQKILLNPERQFELTVLRDGARITLQATPQTVQRLDANGLPQTMGDLGVYVASPPVVGGVSPGSPADQAGLIKGDVITGANGAEIWNFEQIQDTVRAGDGGEITFSIERAGKAFVVQLRPERNPSLATNKSAAPLWLIGINRLPRARQTLGAVDAVSAALVKSADLLVLTGQFVGEMIVGARSPDWLSGPLRIAQFSGHAAKVGIDQFVLLAALLSINLGAINLLPIPALDGGHLLFYGLEKLRGRALSAGVQRRVTQAGLILILGLAGFVLWNDVVNLGLGQKLLTLLTET